jgi:8-amino-7-oxononanoate synthase
VAKVESVVLEAIARVSAYPVAHVKLSQSLPMDLGFDSLMSADLMGELVAAFPGLGDGNDLLKKEMTVGGLVEAIALKMSASARENASELRRDTVATTREMNLSLVEQPWLADHTVRGVVLVPLAFVTDVVVDTVKSVVDVPMAVTDVVIEQGVRLVNDQVVMRVELDEELNVTVSSAATAEGPWTVCYRMNVKKVANATAELLTLDTLERMPLSVAGFYGDYAFHGPSLQAMVEEPRVGDRSVSGLVRSSMTEPASKQLSVLAFDGALQVAAYWTATRMGCIALPQAVAEIRVLRPMTDEKLYCAGVLDSQDDKGLTAHIDVLNGAGEPVLQLRGLRVRYLAPVAPKVKPMVPEGNYRVEAFPEVQALQARKQGLADAGLKLPYFTLHEATARDTSVVNGREVVSFSTYNYLGLSGDAQVNKAAVDAVERYGTSVSASRVAAGERPVHRELEAALARFLGTEDAIVFVGGHATNVTTIGHLVDKQDLILHDALSHDSIIGGAKLSGARHRSFAHNDMKALEKLLSDLRPTARRVLIVVEGVYSMDGDLCPLDQLVELKKKYGALLLVDEAHSLGVLGATGRGVGEHFNVNRADVDLWMGTLSKSLASCGGYIAGSKALVEYLKFTAPGFVYSVGLPAASAAAAKAAVEVMEAEPGRVTILRQRAQFFRGLLRQKGVDTGMSEGSAVVPCIVGDSMKCLKVAAELNAQGVSVHPIVYPAVEEHQARLRFFVSALHSEEQLQQTADTLQSVLAKNVVVAA